MNLSNLSHVSTGLCSGCEQCGEEFGYESPEEFERDLSEGGVFDEGSFSWSCCERCGDTLGGSRYAAHGIDENGELVHFAVCKDCLFELN